MASPARYRQSSDGDVDVVIDRDGVDVDVDDVGAFGAINVDEVFNVIDVIDVIHVTC